MSTAFTCAVFSFCQATVAARDISKFTGVLHFALAECAATAPAGRIGGQTVASVVSEAIDALVGSHFGFPFNFVGFSRDTA